MLQTNTRFDRQTKLLRRLLWPAAVCASVLVVSGGALTRAAGATQTVAEFWIVPGPSDSDRVGLGAAVNDLNRGQAARALPTLTIASSDPVLGNYALLFAGKAQLALGRTADAQATAKQVLAREPDGYLGDAALTLAADAAEAAGDLQAAVQALQTLTSSRPLSPERVWLRLARLAERAGDTTLASIAYWKVYYDFALTSEADDAAPSVTRLPAPAVYSAADRRQLALGRALQLLDAGRFTDARKAYDALRVQAVPDEKILLQLRLAECDYHLKRYTAARDPLKTLAATAGPLQAEASLYYASLLRDTGRSEDYVGAVHRMETDGTEDGTVEEALNDLATYYVMRSDDESAAKVFGEMYRRFPTGKYAERAAWRAGWWAYRHNDPIRAMRMFESATSTLGRVDRRPSFLYWAARAHAQVGDRDAAATGYRRVVNDYRYSYYGRLAQRDLDALSPPRRGGPADVPADPAEARVVLTPAAPPPNADVVRGLLSAGLYETAIFELRKAQVEWGSTPVIEATIAYALNRRGDLRAGITAMRRAYPQFMADGGEALPADLLTVIFPVDHTDLIARRASDRQLDQYLVTALIAQESTFEPHAKSSAGAWGLMQIIPSTGRQYARTLGIRPFTNTKLYDPDTNIRIGTAYFSDLVGRFGDVAQALAAYNAGIARVAGWLAERPGVNGDEFVDDIPYPETQNYVKRVIGTAENYRALYGRNAGH